MEPPGKGELAALAAEGKLKQRIKAAHLRGNHSVHPTLVYEARRKLLRASGLTEAEIQARLDKVLPPSRSSSLPSTGSPKVFVLLVDFADYPSTPNQSSADVADKFFGDGDSNYHPYESVRSYYQRSSYDKLDINGHVFDWYRAQHSRSYYEGLGDGPGQEALIAEVINHHDAQGHDFAQYDNDGDGKIEGFFIKWTGPDNGWANFWWAYKWGWHRNPDYRVDGKRLDNYVWSWISRVEGLAFQPHVDIHETGHLIGLPDYYDYDGTVGPDGALGGLDIMDSNWGDHNCFSKYLLDWLDPIVVSSGVRSVDLQPSGSSEDCVLVMPGIAPGTFFAEFFMMQYRKRGEGNDPPNYPTDGMLIWHIDSRLNSSNWEFEYNNSFSSHKLIRLMEADGLEEIERNFSVDAGDYYLAPKFLDHNTVPNSRTYAGQRTDIKASLFGPPGASMSARLSMVPVPDVVLESSLMTNEYCFPVNGVPDPGEQLAVDLALRNSGSLDADNVTATLQTGGGVSAPSPPQNYGALTAGGSGATRSFTFVADGECGGEVKARWELRDGAQEIGAVSVRFPLGTTIVTFEEDFDASTAMPAGWDVNIAQGVTTKWLVSSVQRHSPPYSVFAPNPGAIADNRLESPPLLFASGGGSLTFQHWHDFEPGFDGGVLEMSIADGSYLDILAAGATFSDGGYGGTISEHYDNPLAGRPAWTGGSAGFVTTTVLMPASVIGQAVRFRWRLGTDSSIDATGWYVDSIAVAGLHQCCSLYPGDFDGDNDADQTDFGFLQSCLNSVPWTSMGPGCAATNLDGDALGLIDLTDLAIFRACQTAPGVSVDPACRDDF